MAANSLFNIPRAAPAQVEVPSPAAAAAGGAVLAALPAAAPAPATPAPSNSVGIITAQQSAITFAGAPAAVTLVFKVIGVASPTLGSSKLLLIGLSILVGMLIYWQTAPSEGTGKQKFAGFFFALINSFAIAAAALGIDSTR